MKAKARLEGGQGSSCPSAHLTLCIFPAYSFISIFCSIIYDQWEEQVKSSSRFLELAALADYRIRAEVMGTFNTQTVWSRVLEVQAQGPEV